VVAIQRPINQLNYKMHYSLVMIGAHDGSKTESLVQTATQTGPAVLIEAVPWIFEKLVQRHLARPQVTCINEALSNQDGVVDFFMLPEEANKINSSASQFGSLNKQGAPVHSEEFKFLLTKMQCPSRTFSTLFKDLNITSLDLLMTDMEGADASTLIHFPFQLLRPRQIIFEAKHSDGDMRLGKNLATLLLILEAQNYRVCMISAENMIAFDENKDSTPPSLSVHI